MTEKKKTPKKITKKITKKPEKDKATKRYMTPEMIETFCITYMNTGNKTESYRQAYPDTQASSDSINTMAWRMFKHEKVQSTLKEMRERNRDNNDITFMSMYDKLEKAYDMSEGIGQPQTMVSATKAQIELLGFTKDKEEQEEKSSRFTLNINSDKG